MSFSMSMFVMSYVSFRGLLPLCMTTTGCGIVITGNDHGGLHSVCRGGDVVGCGVGAHTDVIPVLDGYIVSR